MTLGCTSRVLQATKRSQAIAEGSRAADPVNRRARDAGGSAKSSRMVAMPQHGETAAFDAGSGCCKRPVDEWSAWPPCQEHGGTAGAARDGLHPIEGSRTRQSRQPPGFPFFQF